ASLHSIFIEVRMAGAGLKRGSPCAVNPSCPLPFDLERKKAQPIPPLLMVLAVPSTCRPKCLPVKTTRPACGPRRLLVLRYDELMPRFETSSPNLFSGAHYSTMAHRIQGDYGDAWPSLT